ncbi:2-dehydropantoate 2-reductase [Congregibacter brevis]|uniref:2-dehydropantoate 2-reductase n=1 Tax=Congregibacter brevis TaxID=3081201 RepID=A0ABZ0IK22_9GAMM|nr:2-dehydropantoate 2-reductase [Congregibacter sp. IMCC45268]
MGCLIAHRMQQSELPSTLVHHHQEPIRKIVVDGPTEAHLEALPLHTLAHGSIKRLLITTKAGQVENALALARPYLTKGAVVASTANGMGFEKAAQNSIPDHTFHRAISTAGAFRVSANRVRIVSSGITRIGRPGASLSSPQWFKDSLQYLSGWQWASNIEQAIAGKFSINCIINPLTAVLSCRNGELLDRGEAKAELKALCEETEPALIALGLWSEEEDLLATVVSVCQSTAQNNSSMLQDTMAGRPTEVEFLNGELLRRATSLGISLPLNSTLLHSLR